MNHGSNDEQRSAKIVMNTNFMRLGDIILYSWIWGSCFFIAHSASDNRADRSKLKINEILASNIDDIKDEYDEDEDWVELYNGGEAAVDIGGMYFSDNPKKLSKFQIPTGMSRHTNIPPGGYKLFWFDGEPKKGPYHVSLKLSRKGEALFLTDSDGQTLIDSVRFPLQRNDISYGRDPKNMDRWLYFKNTTPLQPNNAEESAHNVAKGPVYSHEEGFYGSPFELSLSAPSDATIHYTLNGADTDEKNRLTYTGALTIQTNTIVRATVIRPNHLQSETITKSFFIDEQSNVPVISIIMDPHWLYDEDDGIYTNWEDDYEVPGHIEYFPDNESKTAAFASYMGVSIGGNTTRAYPKKSLSIRFRKRWGQPHIKYALWDSKPNVEKFDGLNIRSDMAGDKVSSHPVSGERIKNEIIYEFAHALNSHVDVQAYKPVLLFLNGKYWGLYTLMERKGIDFIQENHGFKEIDMLSEDDMLVKHGDDVHFDRMRRYIESYDMTEPNHYRQVQQWMDVLSFIDYWIFECYSGAHDYEVNIRYWRPRTQDGKWRWLAFDMDSWREWDHDIFEYYFGDEDEQVVMLPYLLKNKDFFHLFANRMCDVLNTGMSPESARGFVRKITQKIEPEIDRERERWKDEHEYVEKGSQIARFMEHAAKRPAYLRRAFLNFYKVKGREIKVKLKVKGQGSIQVNTITPKSYPWTGVYLGGIPITLEARPDESSSFSHWSTPELRQDSKIEVNLMDDVEIEAIFE